MEDKKLGIPLLKKIEEESQAILVLGEPTSYYLEYWTRSSSALVHKGGKEHPGIEGLKADKMEYYCR